MILAVNVCHERISELEFVLPIENVIKHSKVPFYTKHYAEIAEDDISQTQGIIICGTALKDCDYLEHLDKFDWVKTFERPILGICAGFQICAKIFQNELIEETWIGRYEVNVVQENKLTRRMNFHSYFLSSKSANVRKGFVTLAKSDSTSCMIKHEHKEIYGCLFHPEVLNPEIITDFLTSSGRETK